MQLTVKRCFRDKRTHIRTINACFIPRVSLFLFCDVTAEASVRCPFTRPHFKAFVRTLHVLRQAAVRLPLQRLSSPLPSSSNDTVNLDSFLESVTSVD